MKTFFDSILITFAESSPPLSSFCSNLKMVMSTVLKGVYISDKNYNVVVKRNESTRWNNPEKDFRFQKFCLIIKSNRTCLNG